MRTILVDFQSLALALVLVGCAGSEVRPETEHEAESDPVASMALKIRRSGSAYQSAQERAAVEGARESKDIVVGMPMEDVISLWGEPREIFQAGSPGAGNEKWVYFEGLSNRWSLSEYRVLYFEDGRVAGWEKVKAQ